MIDKLYENIKQYIKYNFAFLVFLILFLVSFNIDTDYVIYKPGGSINVSDRLHSNEEYDASKGSFNMAYVGMMKGKLPFYLVAKVWPTWELVKNEDITYNDNETISDSLKRDKIYYDESISNARYVAYQESGTEFTVSNIKNYIVYVDEKCTGNIKIGDEILAYDNITYQDIETLKEYINSKNENDEINLLIKRDNKESSVNTKIFKKEDQLLIGLSASTIYEIKSGIEIKIDSKASESGPSGGLLLSLAIYDALVPDDITKGYKIVGTGTINIDGTVGEIGGVKYKLSGAVKDKADIFIVPEVNYEEADKYAKEKKYDIIIKGVSTFDHTLEILNNMEEKK
ncbi:MAG: PDZ domain-containing protein [Bacilli bacterium]|nr:PDZ domain-containing protein [Bacilli bacterium]